MSAMHHGGEQAGDISTDDLLWPSFSGPSQLAAIERVRLSDRGLPASTYELVRRAAELWPDRPAVSVLPNAESFHTPLVRTFAEFACDVHRASAVLAELGVERGDAVAVVSVNCAELLALLLAAEAGGTYAPFSPGLAPEHAVELVRLSGARVIVASGPELDEGVWAHARGLRGTNPADYSANQPNLDLALPSPFPGDFQAFRHIRRTLRCRFTRERSLVRAQPCPSRKPCKAPSLMLRLRRAHEAGRSGFVDASPPPRSYGHDDSARIG